MESKTKITIYLSEFHMSDRQVCRRVEPIFLVYGKSGIPGTDNISEFSKITEDKTIIGADPKFNDQKYHAIIEIDLDNNTIVVFGVNCIHSLESLLPISVVMIEQDNTLLFRNCISPNLIIPHCSD